MDELMDLIREYRVAAAELFNKINDTNGDCKVYLAKDLKRLEALEKKSLNLLLKNKNE